MPRSTIRIAASVSALLFSGTVAFAQTCEAELGAAEAQTLVEQCLEVSPATRPPCNMDNPCQMIRDEIVRGCEMIGEDAPEFCSEPS